jgi:hypothetical protein
MKMIHEVIYCVRWACNSLCQRDFSRDITSDSEKLEPDESTLDWSLMLPPCCTSSSVRPNCRHAWKGQMALTVCAEIRDLRPGTNAGPVTLNNFQIPVREVASGNICNHIAHAWLCGLCLCMCGSLRAGVWAKFNLLLYIVGFPVLSRDLLTGHTLWQHAC